ncbi:MAG: ATP-binding protein [Prevotella sp.]|nr:ATP-binding protein [Prevotella sp.]
MKKTTIWVIAIVMGLSFMVLLFMQAKYFEAMVQMKKEQFDESVTTALSQASRNLELNETLKYLEKDVDTADKDSSSRKSTNLDYSTLAHANNQPDYGLYSTFELKTIKTKPSSLPKAVIIKTDQSTVSQATKSMRERVKNRYVYQKALLDEVVYNILYTASDKPLRERINFKMLDRDLKTELMNQGIDIPYHFTVSTQDGREVYRCPDYSEKGGEYTYSQALFRNDPANKMGVVSVHFPDMNSYIFSSVRFMIPSLIFTIVLLVTFVFTIVVIFRQKRYSEIKTDFINNMTHELKTPISSISLASQMLGDESVTKSPNVLKHISSVINDEAKRLRFLVEKVLQMSMFDKNKAIIKKKELNLNEMVESVSNTFTLRVEHTGGHITVDLKATNPIIYVDEVHFTNVLFNLLDNAVKYCNPDRALELLITTWNDKEKVYLSVKDNGLGIKKENLKKIFEKFYRVHTGNVHDVKGFGLGLAYVKNIVDLHKGEIHTESKEGKGTNFIISLPFIKQ